MVETGFGRKVTRLLAVDDFEDAEADPPAEALAAEHVTADACIDWTRGAGEDLPGKLWSRAGEGGNTPNLDAADTWCLSRCNSASSASESFSRSLPWPVVCHGALMSSSPSVMLANAAAASDTAICASNSWAAADTVPSKSPSLPPAVSGSVSGTPIPAATPRLAASCRSRQPLPSDLAVTA
jgi:hypothetical protein